MPITKMLEIFYLMTQVIVKQKFDGHTLALTADTELEKFAAYQKTVCAKDLVDSVKKIVHLVVVQYFSYIKTIFIIAKE